MEGKKVGLLGGGQLGRMLIEAANRLNVTVNVLDIENAPAKQISSHAGHITGSFKDQDCIKELAKTSDVLTVEIEHVDTYALEQVAAQIPIHPSWKTLRLIQDKYLQKQHLASHNVAVAQYEEVNANSPEEIERIASTFTYPLMLKSKTQAYDGRGNFPVHFPADISSALKTLADRPLYAEKWASFKAELAVMVVKTANDVLTFPCTETVHQDSICKLTYTPPRKISRSICAAAETLARKAVAAFDGKGVFGVEMFLMPNDTLLVNEIAPRPHNSGHYTIEACALSQYDAHLRAILDLPIPAESLGLSRPAIMLNILGTADPKSHLQLASRALSVPGASVHLYGKGDARPGRKMGHVTITAATLPQAEAALAPLLAFADQLRRSPSSGTPTAASIDPQPLVGVTMGSTSDLPHLIPAIKLLTQLQIPHEVRITSAHRTPTHMAHYGQTAASRGLHVIIAAAGGAAHLPGMLAAHTELPVIGVPVRSTTAGGDGMDALLSIVQMPRGVPVATVGISNAVNAAVLAARILGVADNGIRSWLAAWVEARKDEAMDGDADVKDMVEKLLKGEK